MRVIFRVDSSLDIGAGHVMRCLTLSDELKKRGAQVTFLSRTLPGNLINRVINHGFEVIPLFEKSRSASEDDKESPYKKWLKTTQEEDARQSLDALVRQDTIADWLVVDHYALDQRWEKIVASGTKKIMVIDDLANRPHSCDALLDMTLKRSSLDYVSHVSASCTQMLGSDYIPLHPQFKKLRSESLSKRNSHDPVKKILICLGGMDSENVTLRLLNIIETLQIPIAIDVVLMSTAPHLQEVQSRAKSMTFSAHLHVDTVNMGEIIRSADWGIVAGGMTSFECCCLGLPTSIINTAENQIPISKTLEEMNAAQLIGYHSLISNNQIAREIIKVIKSGKDKHDLSLCARRVCDGEGTRRVVDRMVELS
jgi:UDP-2,4-diacetamido-2,4,6-trideoxy-beta-L-altropyranose hydrolase